jgi:hypothetical protein
MGSCLAPASHTTSTGTHAEMRETTRVPLSSLSLRAVCVRKSINIDGLTFGEQVLVWRVDQDLITSGPTKALECLRNSACALVL